MQVQPSSIMAYRDAVIAAIKGAIPTGVTIEKHDGYFDDETIKRLSFVAPAVYVAVMHAKPEKGAGDFRTHLSTGEQQFELNTVCFVVTKHVGPIDASDLGWAIGEVITNLAVLNAFTDPTMPALDVGIENLWSNKTDKQGLSLLSVHWSNTIVLGTDWAAASAALTGYLPTDKFGDTMDPAVGLQITVNEAFGGGTVDPTSPQALNSTVLITPQVSPTRETFKGFGYVQYIPLPSAAGILIEAGERTPIAMAVNGTSLDTLSGPFEGWNFWDGANFRARAVGDAYKIRLTLIARSTVAGGSIYLDATVNGASAPIEVDRDFLGAVAGVDQILSFHIDLFPKETFVNGGARIYITPDVPVLITNSKLIIEPTNAG